MRRLFVVMVLALIMMMSRHARADNGLEMVEMEESAEINAITETAFNTLQSEHDIDFGMLEPDTTPLAAALLHYDDQLYGEINTAVDVNHEILEDSIAAHIDTTSGNKKKRAEKKLTHHPSIKQEDTFLNDELIMYEQPNKQADKMLIIKSQLKDSFGESVKNFRTVCVDGLSSFIDKNRDHDVCTFMKDLIKLVDYEIQLHRATVPLERKTQLRGMSTAGILPEGKTLLKLMKHSALSKTIHDECAGGDSYECTLKGYLIELDYFNMRFNNVLESFRQKVRGQIVSSCKELESAIFNLIDNTLETIVR